jgi:membrane protein
MQVKRFFRELAHHVVDDDVEDVGAMMAYYAVIALFPMLVFVIALALLVLSTDTVRQGLAMATETMPAGVRDVLAHRVETLMRASGAKLAIGGAVLALWGASRGAVAAMTALNRMFHRSETRSWLRRQMTAFAVTIGVALLIVIALSLLLIGPAISHWFAGRGGISHAFEVAWNIGRWFGASLLVLLVWAIAYRFLPDTDAPFRLFTPGALVGVGLWLGASALFGLYLSHFQSYEATYGALGGAIIFLTWLWISNIALLVGAEINDVIAELRNHDRPTAAQLVSPSEHFGAT